MAKDPAQAANFDAAMADFTNMTAVAVAAAYDFTPFRTIVDVGGGNGALLLGILRATPRLQGIVFDRPDVVARAEKVIAAGGPRPRFPAAGGALFLRGAQR